MCVSRVHCVDHYILDVFLMQINVGKLQIASLGGNYFNVLRGMQNCNLRGSLGAHLKIESSGTLQIARYGS